MHARALGDANADEYACAYRRANHQWYGGIWECPRAQPTTEGRKGQLNSNSGVGDARVRKFKQNNRGGGGGGLAFYVVNLIYSIQTHGQLRKANPASS